MNLGTLVAIWEVAGEPEMLVGEWAIRMSGAGDGADGAGRESSVPSWLPLNQGMKESLGAQTMVQAAQSGQESPRVIIYSESGPVAGDLSACLAGRFTVQRVTSLAAAGNALDLPAAALLVVSSRRDRMGSECHPLFRRAVERGCRVILLGGGESDLDEDLKGKIMMLPQFPSPDRLFEGLSNLPRARKAAEG